MEKKRKKAKSKYKSAESRARQLAGLSGVRISDHVHGCEHIEKVNGKGLFASFSEDQKKEVVELYCNGYSARAIEEKTGISRESILEIKRHQIDHDSQFRDAMFKQGLKEKLRNVVETVSDRILEVAPEMSGKDAALALGITFDKLQALENNKSGVEQLHQHVHLHAASDIATMMDAMKQK